MHKFKATLPLSKLIRAIRVVITSRCVTEMTCFPILIALWALYLYLDGCLVIVIVRLRIATVIALLCISRLIPGPGLTHKPPFWYSLRGRYAIWENLQSLKAFPYCPSSAWLKLHSLRQLCSVSITHSDTTTTRTTQRIKKISHQQTKKDKVTS